MQQKEPVEEAVLEDTVLRCVDEHHVGLGEQVGVGGEHIGIGEVADPLLEPLTKVLRAAGP